MHCSGLPLMHVFSSTSLQPSGGAQAAARVRGTRLAFQTSLVF